MPDDVQQVLAWLERQGTPAHRDGMARFAIPSDKAFGVPAGALRLHAKRLGPNHDLATALWDSGWYEARLFACFVDEPARVTTAQMDRWCRDFDNWAICDTACFALFDRTPHARARLAPWSRRRGEFAKRWWREGSPGGPKRHALVGGTGSGLWCSPLCPSPRRWP